MDKTGPQGMGPMTGRGMGPCGGGLAWGGRGQGWTKRSPQRCCPWWNQDTEDKDEVLKRLEDEKKDLESAIEDLKKS